jgi:hypothetical protein
LRGLLHLPLLLFHSAGPDVADNGTGRTADGGAGRSPAAATITGCGSEHGADAGADSGSLGGTALDWIHVRTAGQRQQRGKCAYGSFLFAEHDALPLCNDHVFDTGRKCKFVKLQLVMFR